VDSAADAPRRPSRVGRNHFLTTAATVVTTLGSHGALIAAAFAVLDAGRDGSDDGAVAQTTPVADVVRGSADPEGSAGRLG
jgi:hypothetical protein